MIRKVIGIISWLPNNETRAVRQERLEGLLKILDNLFALPILIVAQNWDDTVKVTDRCEVKHYPQLGITGARIKLREEFLKSSYDYLIMLDDDADVRGTKDSAKTYMEQIDEHPSGIGIFKGTLLKFFAISRDILQEVEYENIRPEYGEGLEDIVFVEKCKAMFPDKVFTFIRYGLDDMSNSVTDEFSTWSNEISVRKAMGNKSREKLKNILAKLDDNT